MARSVAEGFVSPDQNDLVQVDTDPSVLLDRLQALAASAAAPDDYRRI